MGDEDWKTLAESIAGEPIVSTRQVLVFAIGSMSLEQRALLVERFPKAYAMCHRIVWEGHEPTADEVEVPGLLLGAFSSYPNAANEVRALLAVVREVGEDVFCEGFEQGALVERDAAVKFLRATGYDAAAHAIEHAEHARSAEAAH